MPASQGTPTFFEKIGAVFGLDGANNAAVLAGDQRDLTKGEQAVLSLLQPTLNAIEGDAQGDLANYSRLDLAAVPNITSLSQAVGIVNGALAAENGTLSWRSKT